MKLFLFCLIFCFQSSFGQADSTIYIKEFGWTIKLPSDFKIIDTSIVKAGEISGKKMVEESTGVKADMSGIVRLISAEKNPAITFIANYSISPEITKENWEEADSSGKGVLVETLAKQLPVKGQKSNSIIYIDGVRFKKLQVEYPINDKNSYYIVLSTTFYKSHSFIINYSYFKGEHEIIDMLNNSKFDK